MGGRLKILTCRGSPPRLKFAGGGGLKFLEILENLENLENLVNVPGAPRSHFTPPPFSPLHPRPILPTSPIILHVANTGHRDRGLPPLDPRFVSIISKTRRRLNMSSTASPGLPAQMVLATSQRCRLALLPVGRSTPGRPISFGGPASSNSFRPA